MSRSPDSYARTVLWIVAVLVVGALVAGFATGVLKWPQVQARLVGAPVCQGVDSTGGKFEGETVDVQYGAITVTNDGRGVVYRRLANTDSDYDVVGRLLPDNCQVGFVGFCIGEPLADLAGGGLLDQQWFILPDDLGYVAGSVVQELPPGTIGRDPQECEGGRVEPTAVRLVDVPTLPSAADTTLAFEAPDAVTVGSAYAIPTAGGLTWRQIGVDGDAADGFSVSWAKDASLREPTTVVYSVCWAGNVPGRARGQLFVKPAGDVGAPDPELDEAELRQGASVACRQRAGGGS